MDLIWTAQTTDLYEFLSQFHTVHDNGVWITGVDDITFNNPDDAEKWATERYGYEYDEVL